MRVREASLAEALAVLDAIPDFRNPPTVDEANAKVSGRRSLGLIAEIDGRPVACKYGFERRDGVFYSWVGGVLPEYRRRGVAQKLLEASEQWAASQGYESIEVKSMNRYPAMMQMLLKNGYRIVGVEGDGTDDLKVLFDKPISSGGFD